MAPAVHGGMLTNQNEYSCPLSGKAISKVAQQTTGQSYGHVEKLRTSVPGLDSVLNGNNNFTIFWPSDQVGR